MSEILFKALLNHTFFEANNKIIGDKVFPPETKEWNKLYEVLEEAHNKYASDILEDELFELFKAKYPALSNANLSVINNIIDSIKATPIPNDVICADILRQKYRDNVVQNIAETLINNKNPDYELLIDKITSLKTHQSLSKQVEYVSTNIEDIFSDNRVNCKWKLNYNPLFQIIEGIGPETFSIIGACPEVGKTGFWVSLCFGPGGFLEQGAKVHAICNEEAAKATLKRGISSYTGYTIEELYDDDNRNLASKKFNKIKNNIFIQSDVDLTMEELDLYCKDNEIDILIIDQLDNMQISGYKNNERGVQFFDELYRYARRLAKKYNIAVIAITQAGDGARGKEFFGYSNLYGSKTSKAASADLILCLGSSLTGDEQEEDNGNRGLTIAKNKISGVRRNIRYKLDFKRSRVV